MNVITLRVQNNSTFVDGYLDSTIYKELKKTLGYKDPTATWKASPNPNWDGYITTVCRNRTWCKCNVKKDGTHFPTGLLSKAREFFDVYQVPYSLVNERPEVKKELNYTLSPEYEERFYQKNAIDLAIQKGRGIIKAATGSGKTAMSAGIISRLGIRPFVFYVPSRELLYQAHEEFARFILLDGKKIDVGIVGDSKQVVRDLTIVTIQTALRSLGEKYVPYDEEDYQEKIDLNENAMLEIRNLIQTARGMISDEIQHWASETCQIISDNSFLCKHKFGVSGTPVRDLGDDILIDACFGKTIVDISASFLIKQDMLVKPTVYFVHHKPNVKGNYQTIYKEAIVENKERNSIISKIASNMFQQGRVVLILVRTIPHGKSLESTIPGSFFINGTHSTVIRKEHLAKIRQGAPSITIATSIYDEGVDIKPLNGLILAGSGKSKTRALQRIGRVLRKFPGKKDAFIVDFYDHCKYLLAHSKARRHMYESEPEFEVKDFDLHV